MPQAWTEPRSLSGLHLCVSPAEGGHKAPWRGPHSQAKFSKMLLCLRKFSFLLFLFVRFHLCSEIDNIIFLFFVFYFLRRLFFLTLFF